MLAIAIVAKYGLSICFPAIWASDTPTRYLQDTQTFIDLVVIHNCKI